MLPGCIAHSLSVETRACASEINVSKMALSRPSCGGFYWLHPAMSSHLRTPTRRSQRGSRLSPCYLPRQAVVGNCICSASRRGLYRPVRFGRARLDGHGAGKWIFASRVSGLVHPLQCFTRQADITLGCLAQQCHGLGRAARASFTMEQHHRQVVLAERIAALRGVPEMLPRLDVVAHEPGLCTLQDVRVRIGNGQRAWAFDLCGDGTRAGQQQSAEKVAHDQVLGW